MSNNPDLTAEISVVKGTYWSILGTVFNLISSFIVGVLLARYLGAEGLGIWSLSLLIINLGVMLGSLGLTQGATRFISFYKGQNKSTDITQIIKISVIIGSISSVLIGVIIYFLSPIIGCFFKKTLIIVLIKILAWSIPFLILSGILRSFFRGFEDIKSTTIVNTFSAQGIWLISVIFLVYLRTNIKTFAIFYVIVSIITFISAVCFFIKKHLKSFSLIKDGKIALKKVKELVFFSIPLLFSSFLDFIKTQTDTFMLGSLSTASAVGMYNVAFRIAKFSPILLNNIVAIFIPVISSKIGSGKLEEVKDLYFRSTKWSFIPTLPIIIVLYIFSPFFLNIFGNEFLNGNIALKILLLTYLVHALTGPNGATLVALGKTKFIAFYTFLGALINVILNWIMIPKYNINGAALASLISVIVMNFLASWKLYIHYNIYPFFRNYNFFLLLNFTLGFLLAKFLSFIVPPILGICCFLLTFCLFQLLLMRILKIIDEKDKVLFQKIKNKIKGCLINI